MKYLKKFDTHSDYLTYITGQNKELPNVSLCVQENEVHYNPIVLHDYAEDYLTFVAKESGTFTFIPNNSNVINYSIDNGTTWTEGNSIEVNNDDKVMWKGTITPSNNGIGTFTSTANFDVQGNVMSLLHGDNFNGKTDLTGKDYAFYYLFNNNTKLVNAKNLSLPPTTLAQSCYSSMFQGCTNLTTAPVLPATTLTNYCYFNMFYNCTNLTTAPELPATTLAVSCYFNMFRDCTSLTTAPELPATTLADSCYSSMFNGCTSLATAPELPATTLAKYCYSNIFDGCTSLVNAPLVLPATTLTLNCYSNMFNRCTSLTTAPVLPATTLVKNCYQYMFSNCTNLNYIKAMFTTTPNSYYTSSWVGGVASTGTFVKNSAATWNVTDDDSIPYGWTVQTTSE